MIEERADAVPADDPGRRRGVFVRVSDSDPEMLRYLAERGIAPPAPLEVVDKQPFGGPIVRALRRRRPRPRRRAGRRDARGGRARDATRSSRSAAEEQQQHPELSRLEEINRRGRLRGTLTVLGPAFVACVAYVDPGNFATNIAGGAKYGYLLLWVLLAANLMAMLIQNLSAKMGIATGATCPSCAASTSRARSPGGCGCRPS